MDVGGSTYVKRSQAGQAIQDALATIPNEETQLLGHYRGLELYGYCERSTFMGEPYTDYKLYFKNNLHLPVEISRDPQGQITRIENVAAKLDEYLVEQRQELTALEKQVVDTRAELEKKFEYTDALAELKKEQAQLDRELCVDETPEVLDLEEETLGSVPGQEDGMEV